jgi:hypothetical protein
MTKTGSNPGVGGFGGGFESWWWNFLVAKKIFGKKIYSAKNPRVWGFCPRAFHCRYPFFDPKKSPRGTVNE